MAWNRTGKIDLTAGSRTVLGAGTNWINEHPGWALVTSASEDIYEIETVVSSTELTLRSAPSVTAEGVSFYIIPTQGLNQLLLDRLNETLTLFRNAREGWEMVLSNFSTTAYQLWLDQGNSGSPSDFLAFLKGDQGDTGATGATVYELWLAEGNTGTFADFLNMISGGAIVGAEAARDAAQQAQTGAETARGETETLRDASQILANQVAADHAAVQAIYDTFDDRYLGPHASDPATDNDGDPLLIGARYWNTTENVERVWNGTQWTTPIAAASTSAQQALDAAAQAIAAQANTETARDAAQTFAGAASASETNAAASAAAAAADRDTAVGANQQAQLAASALVAARDAAQTAQAGAETARTQSQTAAQEAATSATTTANDRTIVTQKATEAATARNASYAARDAAQVARDKAQQWADADEDTQVEASQYSAKHHSLKAKAHAEAASIASNAEEWQPGMSIVRGNLYWSPLTFETYRAKNDREVSSVEPSQDEVNFRVSSGGGGGGGAQFAQFEVDGAGDLILSFYDPGGDVRAEDFTIDENGNLFVEI